VILPNDERLDPCMLCRSHLIERKRKEKGSRGYASPCKTTFVMQYETCVAFLVQKLVEGIIHGLDPGIGN